MLCGRDRRGGGVRISLPCSSIVFPRWENDSSSQHSALIHVAGCLVYFGSWPSALDGVALGPAISAAGSAPRFSSGERLLSLRLGDALRIGEPKFGEGEVDVGNRYIIFFGVTVGTGFWFGVRFGKAITVDTFFGVNSGGFWIGLPPGNFLYAIFCIQEVETSIRIRWRNGAWKVVPAVVDHAHLARWSRTCSHWG